MVKKKEMLGKRNIEDMFGYWKAFPENSSAGWGCRAILHDTTVDFVYDRQSWKDDKAQCHKLSKLLDGRGLDQIRQKVSELRKKGELLAHEEQEYKLVETDEMMVIGNTNASYGYLYLLAYLKD